MSLGDMLDSRLEKLQQALDEAQGDIEDLKDRIDALEAKHGPPVKDEDEDEERPWDEVDDDPAPLD
jgi:peptidoglycan hydrolase CwlO-like protein